MKIVRYFMMSEALAKLIERIKSEIKDKDGKWKTK